MIYVLYLIHVICCLFLILVVLLQQGKGADLSVFGGGTTQAAFGARSAATLLHKLTVGFFVLFILTTLSIGIVQRGSGSSSIMADVAAEPESSTDAAAPTPVELEAEEPAAPVEAAADEADDSAPEAADEAATETPNEPN